MTAPGPLLLNPLPVVRLVGSFLLGGRLNDRARRNAVLAVQENAQRRRDRQEAEAAVATQVPVQEAVLT